MAGSYYQGAAKARDYKPVNWGNISLGFAKISEDKRLEAEQKQKEKNAFQIKQDELHGDKIAEVFDSTGIENVDIMNAKIKDGIIAHSEVLNAMYEDGVITQPQLAQRMRKLKAQSEKYSSFITQLGTYADKVNALGSDASQSTREMLVKMDALVKDAAPVIDDDGNIQFLSKDGEKMFSTPFNQLDGIMDFRKKVDEQSIIQEMIKTEGDLSVMWDDKTKQIKKTFLENGKLRKEHKNLISDYTGSFDDKDLYDLAARSGFRDFEFSDKDLFKLENREEVLNHVNEYMEELALGEYKRRDVIDEEKAVDLDQKLKESRLRQASYREKLEKPSFTMADIEDESGKAIGTQFLPAKDFKQQPLPVSSLTKKQGYDESKFSKLGLRFDQAMTVQGIKEYKDDKTGRTMHKVLIQVYDKKKAKTEGSDKVDKTGNVTWDTYDTTDFLTIEVPFDNEQTALANAFRNQIGLELETVTEESEIIDTSNYNINN